MQRLRGMPSVTFKSQANVINLSRHSSSTTAPPTPALTSAPSPSVPSVPVPSGTYTDTDTYTEVGGAEMTDVVHEEVDDVTGQLVTTTVTAQTVVSGACKSWPLL